MLEGYNVVETIPIIERSIGWQSNLIMAFVIIALFAIICSLCILSVYFHSIVLLAITFVVMVFTIAFLPYVNDKVDNHFTKETPTGRFEYVIKLENDLIHKDLITEYEFISLEGDTLVIRDLEVED